MVAQTRLSITLHVYCQSCPQLILRQVIKANEIKEHVAAMRARERDRLEDKCVSIRCHNIEWIESVQGRIQWGFRLMICR